MKQLMKNWYALQIVRHFYLVIPRKILNNGPFYLARIQLSGFITFTIHDKALLFACHKFPLVVYITCDI